MLLCKVGTCSGVVGMSTLVLLPVVAVRLDYALW